MVVEFPSSITPLDQLVRDGNGRIVRDVDDTTFFSRTADRLQDRNQITLAKLLYESRVKPPNGPILDAGCGRGRFIARFPELLAFNPDIGNREIIMVDQDEADLEIARRVAGYARDYYRRPSDTWPQGLELEFRVGDPIQLQRMVPGLIRMGNFDYAVQKFGMIWFSTVFHWIRGVDAKYKTLENFYDMLADGGVLALCVSTKGTAGEFLEAYRNIIEGLGVWQRVLNEIGYKAAKFRKDPIGSVNPLVIEKMVYDSGFQLVGDPIPKAETEEYTSPTEYAESVAAYGKRLFLRPVSHLPEDYQNIIWDCIVAEHARIAKRNGWREGQPYIYRQHNLYLVTVRRSALESTVPAVAAAQQAKTEIPLYNVGYVLHPQNPQFKEQKLATTYGRNLDIAVQGDPAQIENRQTNVDLGLILWEVLTYAAANWLVSHPPTFTSYITYSVEADQLKLGLGVNTIHRADFDEILSETTLQRLRNQDVTMDVLNQPRTRVYQFKIPLIQPTT